MAAVRFRFRNRPALSARETRVVAELLRARGGRTALRLADKILAQAASNDRLIADIRLKHAAMVELLATLNEHAEEHRISSDEVYRLRAELESALNRT